jgi:sugar phosphate isomerase/epimerase
MRLGMVANLYHEEMKQKGQENLEYILNKAKSLGISVVSGGLGRCSIEEARRLLDKTGIEMELGWAYNYCTKDQDEHKRRQELFKEFLSNVCKPLNVHIVGTCATVTHRWLKEPPLSEQIELIAENIRPLALIAQDYNVIIAIENHADYRGHEIAEIIRRVNEPNFGARLDTGNPFWTFEEPVDAAKAMAPVTFTTHIKDLYVDRFAQWKGVPLGQGHVDFDVIIGDMLANNAPFPKELPLVIEVEAIKDSDPTLAADESVRYLKEKFGHLLDL